MQRIIHLYKTVAHAGCYCLASFQIASSLTKELCALVFGINTFFGTVLKTIISLIFTDKRGLALDVHSQVKQSNSRDVSHQCFLDLRVHMQ